MSIRRYRVHGSAAEASRRIEQDFVPLISRGPHFHAYYVLDPERWDARHGLALRGAGGGGGIEPTGGGLGRAATPALVSLEETTIGDVTVRAGM